MPNENPDLRRAADKATRAACNMLEFIRGKNVISAETNEWIGLHDREDSRRKAKEQDEQDRKSALKKLTPRERALLGHK